VFIVAPDGQPIAVALRLGTTDGRMTEVLAGELVEGQAVIAGTSVAPAEASAGRGLRLAGLRLL
jgi:HlyD family secretion protein